MDDVKAGKVNCIVVKDLSRFGRDYIETGNYLEKIFPFLGVRFISITDRFDSFACDDAERALMVPLKNMVNDVYAKISAGRSLPHSGSGRRQEISFRRILLTDISSPKTGSSVMMWMRRPHRISGCCLSGSGGCEPCGDGKTAE